MQWIPLTQGPNATILAFKGLVREADPARPVAFNAQSGQDNDLDVAGWSHQSVEKFATLHAREPDKPLVSSECCSCTSERGSRFPSYRCLRDQNAPG